MTLWERVEALNERMRMLEDRFIALEDRLPKAIEVVDPVVQMPSEQREPDAACDDGREWRRRALVAEERLASAEAELRRLGYGEEAIFTFNADCEPLATSHVGDLCWDTRENRRRTFEFIERTLARARVATEKP